jgi:hypothetical protein
MYRLQLISEPRKEVWPNMRQLNKRTNSFSGTAAPHKFTTGACYLLELSRKIQGRKAVKEKGGQNANAGKF